MTETRSDEDWERQLVRMASGEKEHKPDQAWRSCANHPETEAAFQCAGCGHLLCDACTEAKTIGGETSRFCRGCGGACNSLDELKAAKPIEASDDIDKLLRAKAAVRSLPPEPLPVDRQLGSVLFFPFLGSGAVTILTWVALVWVAWPLGVVLLLPYLAQLYVRVEEAGERIPAPWHIGGGLGSVSRFLAKLIITPGLPLALCYVLLLPGSERAFSAIVDAPTGTGSMAVHPAGAGVAILILFLTPLAIILLLRTGNPFTSLDPIVLWSILKPDFGRYLTLLLSMLVFTALSAAMFLAMKQTPVGNASVHVIKSLAAPPLGVILPGIVLFLWWTVGMAFHGKWIGWVLGEESEQGDTNA